MSLLILMFVMKKQVLDGILEYDLNKDGNEEWILEFKTIIDVYDCRENDIKSSGYVIDSLKAAIWSFIHSNSYENCIRTAVSLGNDTDTIAAIAGGLAGIYKRCRIHHSFS